VGISKAVTALLSAATETLGPREYVQALDSVVKGLARKLRSVQSKEVQESTQVCQLKAVGHCNVQANYK